MQIEPAQRQQDAMNGAQDYSPKPLRRRLVIGLILVCISVAYLFLSIARGPRAPFFGYTTELYALLAQSFSHGRTALPIEPRPELLSLPDPYDPDANYGYRLHDASLYKGRYYLYFGPVPVVTLFLPYRLATGRDLPNRVAVPIFCIAGFLSSCALFFLLARHNGWRLPLWLQCAIIVSLGSMSLVALIIRWPTIYQVPIAAGYFFDVAGFQCLARAMFARRAAGKLLLVAGIMFGMAAGCRPHLALVCAVVLGAFIIWTRRSPGRVIALAAGMVACGIVLAAYNYVRFDDPFEFGRSYQLTGFSVSPISTYYGLEVNLDTVFFSAKEILFLPPHVDATVPFFHTVFINPLPGHPGRPRWMEDMVGLIPASPFGCLGFFTPLLISRRRLTAGLLDRASKCLLYAMYCSGIVVFVLLCVVGWVLGRYLVDFAPFLTILGASIIAVLWQKLPQRPIRGVFSWVVGAAVVYGAVVNTALATPRLDLIQKFLRR